MEFLNRWKGTRRGFLVGQVLVWVLLMMLGRIVMMASSWGAVSHAPGTILSVLVVGAFYDVCTGIFLSLPSALFLLLPQHFLSARVHRGILFVLVWALNAAVIFGCVSLFLYWQEFHTNFNFVAVDYLVYTREMLGNIKESYPVGRILFGVGVLAALVTFLEQELLPRDFTATWKRRLALFAVIVILPVLVVKGTSASWHMQMTDNRYDNELAGSGPYELIHAYFANELDYPSFYAEIDQDQMMKDIRDDLAAPNATFTDTEGIRRHVENDNALTGRRPNVILITVESLSSSFCGAFGAETSYTPYLDELAKESYCFTDMYATGTRTVRGLEAITLSVPPTPGQSILRRPQHADMGTLGDAFAQNGYERDFLYGGYGYFDNMNAFFEDNGYTVKDRLSIPKDEIFSETVWGVADEILFTEVLKSMDAHAAAGELAFEMIMTTSNHRPFHFPDGRVEGAEQGKREGAVRYTDWAIHDFIERAKDKPWFNNTVFVIVADHQASAAGKTDLPVERYHIPCLVYAPGMIAPGKNDHLMSQIDIAPTLLGMLGLSYTSTFMGLDVLHAPPEKDRAFISTYQNLGFLKDDQLIELTPDKKVAAFHIDDWTKGTYTAETVPDALREDAITWYQGASYLYKNGFLQKQ